MRYINYLFFILLFSLPEILSSQMYAKDIALSEGSILVFADSPSENDDFNFYISLIDLSNSEHGGNLIINSSELDRFKNSLIEAKRHFILFSKENSNQPVIKDMGVRWGRYDVSIIDDDTSYFSFDSSLEAIYNYDPDLDQKHSILLTPNKLNFESKKLNGARLGLFLNSESDIDLLINSLISSEVIDYYR